MNENVKSGFLNEIFLPRENLLIDYSFLNPTIDNEYKVLNLGSNVTGYLIYNLEQETGVQYDGSKVIDTGHPALSISDSGGVFKNIVSGHFNGISKYRVLGDITDEDWTAYIVFKHLETGIFNQNKVLISSKPTVSSPSGFIFGINGCNRLFYEYETTSSGKRIFTLNKELDNKNLASISKIDSDLYISLHQYEDLNSFSIEAKFPLNDFNPSYQFYIGGLETSGLDYRNFSGYIDQFVFINRGLDFPERNTFSEAFFCSGYNSQTYQGLTNIFNVVTGVRYENTLIGTGITGYSQYLQGYQIINGQSLPIYSYSGLTGNIYSDLLIELTGIVTGDYEIATLTASSGLPNYNYLMSFCNSKILSFNNFDDSYKEVYSFSGRNTDDINLNAAFINPNLKFSVLTTGSGENINFYVNGLAQILTTTFSDSYTGELVPSGTFLDSQGFFDRDDIAIYDFIQGSGSITGASISDETNGFINIPSSFINNRDIYLNGIKMISGIDYSPSGSSVVLAPSGFCAGDIVLLPKHNSNLVRYTGYNNNNFETSIPLFDEQVWINGLRQVKYADYEKLSDFSLKYTTFSLEPYQDIIYNNDTGFFNV